MHSKTFKRILIGLLFLAIIAFGILEYTCRQGEDCKCSAYSMDKATAIKEGFYIAPYSPKTKTLAIPNTNDTITFGDSWTEHTWQMSNGLCLFKHKVHGDTYNFCMTLSTVASDINTYPFDMKPLGDTVYDFGSYNGDRYNFGISKLSDTVKVLINQKNSDTASKQYFSDTLLFIRTKNGK
jgi:hypothetical protein